MIARIIGDVHGKIDGYFDVLDDLYSSYEDEDLRSLQIGDMGFEEEYRARFRYMNQSEEYDTDEHVFFGGNHDNYDTIGWAEALGDFGRVPFISSSFFVRGAQSIDKDMRTEGHDYWSEEELSWKRSNEAVNEYIKLEPDYVFSHDCPGSVAGELFPSKDLVNSHTNNLLSEMFSQHKPRRWIFGHWHSDQTEVISGTEFTCLGELSYIDLEF